MLLLSVVPLRLFWGHFSLSLGPLMKHMVIPFQGLYLIASVNVLAQVGSWLQIFRSKGFGTDLGRVIIQPITAPHFNTEQEKCPSHFDRKLYLLLSLWFFPMQYLSHISEGNMKHAQNKDMICPWDTAIEENPLVQLLKSVRKVIKFWKQITHKNYHKNRTKWMKKFR